MEESKVTGDLTTLGTALKPSVPNVTFKATVDAVIAGRTRCGFLLMEVYSLDQSQIGLLKHHIDKWPQH